MFNEELRIEDMSLEGFRIVQSQYFSKLLEPSMTIWSTSISFNMMAYAALNNCDKIQILVHDKEKSVIIKPSHSQEPNAIDWKKTTSKTKSGRLECTAFMRPLFQRWGLNPECRYPKSWKGIKLSASITDEKTLNEFVPAVNGEHAVISSS